MIFLTYYKHPNQQLVHNLCLLPRRGDTMHKLEGFQFVTTMDINIDYYIEHFSRHSKDMTTIVTKFSRYQYNYLMMEIFTYGGFQDKLYYILRDNNVF